MKLTILGKYGASPKANGATSGYLLSTDNTKILLDCGSGVLSRLFNYTDIENVSAIILSHLHFDHSSDMLVLQYLLQFKGKNLTVYCPKTDTEWAKVLYSLPNFNFVFFEENKTYNINEISFTTRQMIHKVPSFAIKISHPIDFVYSGDTIYCDKLLNFCFGAKTLLLDSAQTAEKSPHMMIDEGRQIAKATNAKLLITHIPPNSEIDIPEEVIEGKEYFL